MFYLRTDIPCEFIHVATNAIIDAHRLLDFDGNIITGEPDGAAMRVDLDTGDINSEVGPLIYKSVQIPRDVGQRRYDHVQRHHRRWR